MAVALVTGASRGLGAAIAKSLAADGHAVAVNFAHDEAGAEHVVAAIVAAGGKARRYRFDVTDEAAVAAGVAEGGTARVDAWVLSCRAFSRRIEHHMTDRLFARLGIPELRLSFQPTERNGPAAEFVAKFAGEGQVIRDRFREDRPPLPHEIEEIGYD